MPAKSRPLWIASGLFVLSGATALVYETIWFKQLGHAWGNSSLAMACVVATFLAGLGLGAWLFGRIADRARDPLAIYGWCEIAIGVLALVIAYEMRFLTDVAASISARLSETPGVLVCARFLLTFLVIGPACVLMGATFPLLTRRFATSDISVGASTAWLYAANTLGAAAGAWLAGFVLLERFGLPSTNALTAAINVAAGVVALGVASRSGPPVIETKHQRRRVEAHISPGALRVAALATGFASIALQMLWARDLALLVGGTTYAFSATIATFILGLGLGSLFFRFAFGGSARLEWPVCLTAALIVVSAMVGFSLRPSLALAVGDVREMRASGAFNAWVCAGTAAALQLVPTIGMGFLFPALVALARNGAAEAGRTVGVLYAWNTLGSIAGAALTALVVLPSLGSFWSARVALLIYAAIPLVLLGARRLPLAVAVASSLLLFVRWKAPDPIDTNCGAYLYGPEIVANTHKAMHTEYFAEGPACNVLVLASNHPRIPRAGEPSGEHLVNLRVNGKIDASNGDDMPLQLGLAYVPRLLRPRARNVLVIGMGSGVTAGASALFPGTHVTVCEIEPAIVDATRWFEPWNHAPTSAANVRVVIDDGRSFVQAHRGDWDLILSEPSNPWIAGIGNLFTEEFYRVAQTKLTHDGILAQWVQNYSFGEEEYALVARTIMAVFPRCVFVRINDHDTMILASSSDVLSPGGGIDPAQALVDANPVVAADLLRWFATKDVRSLLLSRIWLNESGVRRFLAGERDERLNTDANLALEFAAPRHLFQTDPSETTLRIMRRLAGAYGADLHRRLFAQWGCGPAQVGVLKELKVQLSELGNGVEALEIVALALELAPDDMELVADRLLFDTDDTEVVFEAEIERIIVRSPKDALWLGRQLSKTRQHNAARVVFEKLVATHPTSSTAWAALSMEQRALGKTGEAEKSRAKARELERVEDPLGDLSPPVESRSEN